MAVKPIIDTVSILQSALESGLGAKYKKLAEALEVKILDGTIEAGAKLPPHRALADRLGITIGTVSRVYAELERMGLVVARVGDGTFVRRRGLERKRDEGFRNFIDEPQQYYDMSRNMHIPGHEIDYLSESLMAFASDPKTLQDLTLYTPDVGLPRYRMAGARWLGHDSFEPQADQVICTNGGQHGLLCALLALLRAGDTIATEQLTYPGLITAARFLGIKILGVDMDEQGIIPAALEELCRSNRISALYCTPTIQNPTTAVLSPQRREELARVCRDNNLLIIEDEAHGVLVEDRPLPLTCHAPERTILISSLSKAVAAGLRVGYLHAPNSLQSRLAASLRATCWMATPLALELATHWIDDGTADRLRRQQVHEISRRKSLVEGLLFGLNYRTHPQSPHFWIEVPEPWRASEIEADLKQKNYLITAAEAFAVGRSAVPQYVRASVSNASSNDQLLSDGFQALARTLKEEAGQFAM
ncbi:PLP-dependent aminotransferase family protein [Pseudomonas indica]|uniref:DNA-binding transcriptional regulator, MocR family, contains an aminotransferase domain n=1 Tax=Pseudomonas indica TaxID=137658 RepID=A0A1G9EGM4_9PSED|nr:PLP-dependent aminotransferase family protein [Pseudomonas indica]MBU3056081.1 PLP-dependent aminotransferase family protein [Pseudomonas indica]SDK75327.1 DNA-binding transcriptional regulator, MocR family, contains an aminotransferase domain [Pseudomonas indica]